jgi:Family of unknown function (DUF6101)
MKTGLKPVWAGRDLRLDPFRLPQAVTYATRDSDGDVSFTITEKGAVIKRHLEMSGLPLSIALPPRAFAGVAARAIEDEDGEITVTLELHHIDPALCVPLLVAHDLDDIAADWRAWASAFRIPMLLIERDGSVRNLAGVPEMPDASQVARRPVRLTKSRRPRFLVRRKVGGLGCRAVLQGREIIARR